MTIVTITVCDAIHANVGHLPHGHGRRVHHRARARPVDRRGLEGAPRRGPHLPGPRRFGRDRRRPRRRSGRGHHRRTSPGGPRPPPRTSPPGNAPGSGTPPSTCSLSAVTPVVNALVAGGIAEAWRCGSRTGTSPRPRPPRSSPHAGGPFPIVGVQYRNAGDLRRVGVQRAVARPRSPGTRPSRRPASTACTSPPASSPSPSWPPSSACRPSALLRMTAVQFGTFGDPLAAYLNAVHAGTKPASTPLPGGNPPVGRLNHA